MSRIIIKTKPTKYSFENCMLWDSPDVIEKILKDSRKKKKQNGKK